MIDVDCLAHVYDTNARGAPFSKFQPAISSHNELGIKAAALSWEATFFLFLFFISLTNYIAVGATMPQGLALL